MPMTPAATVASAIKARLAELDTGDEAPDQDAALEAVVDEIRKMVLAGTVSVTGAATDPISGALPVTATGALT